MPAAAGKPQLAPRLVEQLEEVFQLFDVDQSGAIDYLDAFSRDQKLKVLMKVLGIEIKKEELKMITDVDSDGSGRIEFPEFLEMMTAKMGQDGDGDDDILEEELYFGACEDPPTAAAMQTSLALFLAKVVDQWRD